MTEPEDGPQRAPRVWPRGQHVAEADLRDAQCSGCGEPWRVHKSMCGFRLRCDCGAWIEVAREKAVEQPLLVEDRAALTPAERTAARRAEQELGLVVGSMHRDESGLVHVRAARGEVVDAPMPTSMPLAPGALQSSKAEWRARWTSVAILEITAVLAAILVPQLAAFALSSGREGALLMPFASLLGGMAVLAIAAFSGPYGTIGLRRPSSAAWLESLVAPVLAFLFAMAWCKLLFAVAPDLEDADALDDLLDRLGPQLAVFTVAVMPAIVEEIAFRGMLQGRLMALLGARQGFVVTAMAFTLVHLSPATMPIHLGLGLYLGWLRQRSGSLWPGMVVHFAYNTMVLLLME
jgi:membrane protease YdiL (CAAX protease family)